MSDTETPETETETAEEAAARAIGARSQLAVHEGQVEYLRGEGVDVDNLSPAELIAAAYATRNEWRRTDAYRTVKAASTTEKAAEREAAKAARAEAVAAKKAERDAAKAAKAAEKAAKAEAPAEAKPAKASRKRKASTETPAEPETTDEAGDDEDNPFGE
jgi:hypothetical protein